MKKFNIEMRSWRELERYIGGCEGYWDDWAPVILNLDEDKVEENLAWWRDLNAMAVRDRGEGARREFRAVEVAP